MSSTTLYFERKDADALAVCASASLYSTELDVKSVSGVQGLPKAVALPLPAAGLPVLALPSGVIVQGAAAACASLLGAHVSSVPVAYQRNVSKRKQACPRGAATCPSPQPQPLPPWRSIAHPYRSGKHALHELQTRSLRRLS